MKIKLLVVLTALVVVGGFVALFSSLATDVRAQQNDIVELRTEMAALQRRADALEIEVWREWVTNAFWDAQGFEGGEKQLPSLYVQIVRADSAATVRRSCAEMVRILESMIENADQRLRDHLEAQVKEYNRLATMIGG